MQIKEEMARRTPTLANQLRERTLAKVNIQKRVQSSRFNRQTKAPGERIRTSTKTLANEVWEVLVGGKDEPGEVGGASLGAIPSLSGGSANPWT